MIGEEYFAKTKGISIHSERFRVPNENGYVGYRFGGGEEGLFFFDRFGILARVSKSERSIAIWKIESSSFDEKTPRNFRKMVEKEEKIFMKCDVFEIPKGKAIQIFTKWKDRFIVLVSSPTQKQNPSAWNTNSSTEFVNSKDNDFFFDYFNVCSRILSSPSQISFRNEKLDIGFQVNKIMELKDDILILFGCNKDEESFYRLISFLNEENVKMESETKKMKYRISENLIKHSKVHRGCSYYLCNSGVILYNFNTNKFIRFVFGSDKKREYEYGDEDDPMDDVSMIYEIQPFIISSGKEYIVSAGNFPSFYVHDTDKENELIHTIDVLKGSTISYRSCWYSCLIDDTYFVCGNHDRTISFNHIDPITGILRKIDEREMYCLSGGGRSVSGSGIRALHLIEKKSNSMRFIVQYSLGERDEMIDHFTVLTLSNVPFLRPQKFFDDEEDEKERLEYVLNIEGYYFTVDEMSEFGIEIIIPSHNFRLKLSKLFLL